MRELLVRHIVDCKRKRCGRCHGVGVSNECKIYDRTLSVNKKGQPMRLEQCLSDEAIADEEYLPKVYGDLGSAGIDEIEKEGKL